MLEIGQTRKILPCPPICIIKRCFYKPNVGRTLKIVGPITKCQVWIDIRDGSTVNSKGRLAIGIVKVLREPLEAHTKVITNNKWIEEVTEKDLCSDCGTRGQWVNFAMKCPNCWKVW